MLASLGQRCLRPARGLRLYSQSLAAAGTEHAASTPPAAAPPKLARTPSSFKPRPKAKTADAAAAAAAASTPATVTAAGTLRHAYFVPRNSMGSVPVFTDTRSQTKQCTLIRNVEGDVQVLAKDLQQSLFAPGSLEAERLKVDVVRGRHIVLNGGHWKRHVVQWLQAKGF